MVSPSTKWLPINRIACRVAARTADQFIEDKLGQGDFIHHETRSSAFLVNASAWALGMSARVIQPGETPQGTIGRLTKRLGAPAGCRWSAS